MKKTLPAGVFILIAITALALAGCAGTTDPVQSGEKKLLSFEVAVAGEYKPGAIDEALHTVSLTLPAGTNVTALSPVIAVSEKAAVSPASGVMQDFSNPVTYTVTAENGSAQPYTVTVLAAANKTALNAAITAATAAKSGVLVDTDAANVSADEKWVTQAEMDALNTAIAAAEAVSQNVGATQPAVDAAVTTLNTAVLAFNEAKKAGSLALSKTALNDAITAAENAKSGTEVSDDAAKVLVGTKWVAGAVMTAFNEAIAAAKTVSQNPDAIQSAVDAAVTALDNAVTVFNTAKQDGTKPGPAEDKTALTGKITAATTAKGGIEVDTDAANILAEKWWVTQAVMTAFDDAIAAAEEVSENPDAIQSAVDAAVTALDSAITTFNEAKQAGIKAGSAQKTPLSDKITAATTAKSGVVVNTAAGNVPEGTQWVTQMVMNAFNDAIAVAEAAVQNAGITVPQVNDAVAALNNAITTFNAAKQDGTKPPPAQNTAELTGKITAANNAKNGIVVDTAAGNVAAGTSWVTQTVMTTLNNAIAAAGAVLQNTESSQDAVNTAVTTLEAAITAFNTAKQAGTKADSGSVEVAISVPPFTDNGAGIIPENNKVLTLYRNGTPATATVTLIGTNGAAIAWRTGNTLKGTGTSLTISAGEYNRGTYHFSVELVKDGVPWSAEFTLIIEDNQPAG
jgi:hypothetical protein